MKLKGCQGQIAPDNVNFFMLLKFSHSHKLRVIEEIIDAMVWISLFQFGASFHCCCRCAGVSGND